MSLGILARLALAVWTLAVLALTLSALRRALRLGIMAVGILTLAIALTGLSALTGLGALALRLCLSVLTLATALTGLSALALRLSLSVLTLATALTALGLRLSLGILGLSLGLAVLAEEALPEISRGLLGRCGRRGDLGAALHPVDARGGRRCWCRSARRVRLAPFEGHLWLVGRAGGQVYYWDVVAVLQRC